MLELVACPVCLSSLEYRTARSAGNKNANGKLHCPHCQNDYLVKNGVPVFGISQRNYQERLSEINGERNWTLEANPLPVHLNFARNSAKVGEQIIHDILRRTKSHGLPRVLDVGSGWGCFQSWQFASHNCEVTAVELCPEFIFSSDVVSEDIGFMRLVSDCSILPFRDSFFDIVFCKELVHHLGNAQALVEEMWRVCAEGGLIVMVEPCTPVLRNRRRVIHGDRAAKSGITHHSYTYNDYFRYIKPITSELEITGEIHTIDPSIHPLLHGIQKPMLALLNATQHPEYPAIVRHGALEFTLTFIGGTVTLVGRKNSEHIMRPSDRRVVPISTELFDPSIAKRLRKIVKPVFAVYQEAREECEAGLGPNAK